MSITQIEPAQFDELAALEAELLETDGVRLKLEWASIRSGANVASLVFTDRERVIGFIGLSSWDGPPNVELVGMVHPEHRRQGVMTRLLDRALEICEAGGYSHRLLVVPRGAPGAEPMVSGRGAELEHSEYSLGLHGPPSAGAPDPDTVLRDATEHDRAARIAILSAGFGALPPDATYLDQLRGEGFWTVMIDHAGAPVGQARLSLNDGRGAIAGFAIDPEYRGRGIGRDALARLCQTLREHGAQRVELQVEAENDLALGLYTSTGFQLISTEDYYRLPS